jgi:hypothetical protein
MEVSNCCGVKLYDDYDICPKCLEHCGREKEDKKQIGELNDN